MLTDSIDMSSLLCVDTLGSFQRYKRLSVGCLNTSWINSIQLTSSKLPQQYYVSYSLTHLAYVSLHHRYYSTGYGPHLGTWCWALSTRTLHACGVALDSSVFCHHKKVKTSDYVLVAPVVLSPCIADAQICLLLIHTSWAWWEYAPWSP